MKNVNTNLKSVLSTVMVILALFLVAAPAMANNDKKTEDKKSLIEVKYIGSNHQSPIVEINLENESGEEMIVSIKDVDGNVLYKESFFDKKISRKVQFDNFSLDPIQIKLTASTKGKNYSESFQINRNRVVVEEVKIAKL
ncbi:hypothetical protein ACFSQD_08505 [Flavihumibacter stibioxidans]|nr:hypothetical protein [Flavihumibacter stibioxidans]